MPLKLRQNIYIAENYSLWRKPNQLVKTAPLAYTSVFIEIIIQQRDSDRQTDGQTRSLLRFEELTRGKTLKD